MSTWVGTILGGTMGTAHGLASAAVATVATGGDLARAANAYGASQQVWMGIGDVASNIVVNYDTVAPKDIANGDLFVMWGTTHTYLVLETAKCWTIWEHCGTGIGTSSGGTLKSDPIYEWEKVRKYRNGSHGYIVHHVSANHSIAEVDRVREKIRHKYDKNYCLATRNCHHFCDEMLMELGHFAMGGGYAKTAASGYSHLGGH